MLKNKLRKVPRSINTKSDDTHFLSPTIVKSRLNVTILNTLFKFKSFYACVMSINAEIEGSHY